MNRRLQIGVMGGSTCDEAVTQLAFEVGAGIAERGGVLVCGGYGGVMAAAARGAKGVGGLTVGVLSGVERGESNPYIDIEIITGLRDARNAINALSCDVMIAIAGGVGTLSEIALALNAKRPVVGLRTWRLESDHYDPGPLFASVETSIEAVEAAFARATH